MVLCKRLTALGLVSFLPLLVFADQYGNQVGKGRRLSEQTSSTWKGGSINENPTIDPDDTALPHIDDHQHRTIAEESSLPIVLPPEPREEREDVENPNLAFDGADIPPNLAILDSAGPINTNQNSTDRNSTDQGNTNEVIKSQNETDANNTDQREADTVKANQNLVVHFEYKLDFFDNVNNVDDIIEEARNTTIDNLNDALDTFFGDNESDADVILESLDTNIIGSCENIAEGAVSCNKGNGTISLAHSNEISPTNLFNTALTEAEKAIATFNENRTDVQITYLGPKHFTAEVYVELRGVPERKMDINDTDIFEDALLEFLDERLKKEFGDHITIQQVTVVTQFISVQQSRALRSGFVAIRRDEEEISNRALVHVTGLCGFGCDEPPDHEDIESTIDKGSDDLVRDLKEAASDAGSDYFQEVTTIIPASIKPPKTEDAPPIPKDGDSLNTEDGYAIWALFLIAAPVAAAIIVCFCFFRAMYCKEKHKDAEVVPVDARFEPGPDDTENLVGMHGDDTTGFREPMHMPPPGAFENASKSSIESYNVSKSTIVSAKSEREPTAPSFEQTDSGLWNRKMAMADDRQPDEFEDEVRPGPQSRTDQEDDLWQRKVAVGRNQEGTEGETFGDEAKSDGAPMPGAQAANEQEDKLWRRKVAVGNEDNLQQSDGGNNEDEGGTAGETKPGAQNVQGQEDKLWDRKVAVANEAQAESVGGDDNTEVTVTSTAKSTESKPGAQHAEGKQDERWERKIAVARESPAEADVASQSTEYTCNTSRTPGVENVKKQDEDSLWARKMDEASKADDSTTDT